MPELRKDPVAGRWVVFSPERLRRPVHIQCKPQLQAAEQENPFLSGNEAYTLPEIFAIRDPGSAPNKPGWRVRVVANLFPALRIEGELEKEAFGFYDRMNGIGAHEVIIETPDPNMALDQQPIAGIADVLRAFRSRMLDLAKDTRFRYILVFKNFGAAAGATLPHPHSQLIAMPVVPIAVKEKLKAAMQYYRWKDRNLFGDILNNERKSGDRMVYENAGFSAFCPFASRFPFELCIMPRKQSPDFSSESDHNLVLLADVLKRVLQAYRRGLSAPDYNLIIHTAPLRYPRKDYWMSIDQDFWWHIEILPRMAGMAGFEFGTGFYINPVFPEESARFLRGVKTDV
ncbi:MAG: DUF4931 domain-containing protein [bacterium]